MFRQYREYSVPRSLAPFKVDGLALPYPEFVPRLYNFCKSLGFRKGLIMPSRAFCSDENQGMPIILLTKHFGTFPFNHGRVGGIMAIDRHGPHSHHGEDLVIVQASHVGYNPETGVYGRYARPQMLGKCVGDSCGKLAHVITPYLDQYRFAKDRIFLHRDEQGRHLITVKNSFIDFTFHPVKDGLVLRLQNIVKIYNGGVMRPLAAASTSQIYEVSDEFRQRVDATNYQWKSGAGEPIGDLLREDMFFFREDFHETDESILLERNLIEFMPDIVTAKHPALRAATINIQLEFTRVVESIRRGTEYKGRNLLYINGLNVDISEYDDFPSTTYFVPWAAHIQLVGDPPGEHAHPMEQDELFANLMKHGIDNPDQVNLKEEIGRMLRMPHFDIRSSK